MMVRGPFGAVVFDMDGVLADSEPAHLRAINKVLARYGSVMTAEQQATQLGHGLEESMQAYAELLGLDVPPRQLAQQYSEAVLRELAAGSRALPGAVELVKRLKELGVPVAVASSSLSSWVDATLTGLGLSGRFDVIMSGEMVANPKPAPDIYLFAAEKLAAAPSLCIAIEDAPAGLASAKAAGMYAVQVRSASTAFPPQAEADLVLESLAEFDLRLVGR